MPKKRPAWDLRPRLVDVATLRHHPRNVRQGNVEVIRESLRAHDQYAPLLVQESTRYIVKGNHTFAALCAEGYEQTWAVVLPLDDDQALRIMLMDNRAGDLAHNDDTALLALLDELGDLAGTGFDDHYRDDLRKLLVPPDLDDLLDDLGQPEGDDLWATVKVKLPPAEYGRWLVHAANYDDHSAALAALLPEQ